MPNSLYFFLCLFRDRDLSRHDSGLSVSNNASVSSPASFASSKSCIVYRHRGGHFIGRERMDFVRYLSEMNMDHVVEKIFSFLDATDLCRVACTSTRWHNHLISDTPSNLKRMDFLIDCKKNRVSDGFSEAHIGFSTNQVLSFRKIWRRAIGHRGSPRERPWATS